MDNMPNNRHHKQRTKTVPNNIKNEQHTNGTKNNTNKKYGKGIRTPLPKQRCIQSQTAQVLQIRPPSQHPLWQLKTRCIGFHAIKHLTNKHKRTKLLQKTIDQQNIQKEQLSPQRDSKKLYKLKKGQEIKTHL